MYDTSNKLTGRKPAITTVCKDDVSLDSEVWYHHQVYGGSAQMVTTCEGVCWYELLGTHEGNVSIDEEKGIVYAHTGTVIEGYDLLLEEMLWNRGQAHVCE